MKRILAVAVFAVVLALVPSCIFEERSDVVISYAVASVSSSSSPEELMADLKKVEDAFSEAFSTSGIEAMGPSYLVLRNQPNNKNAASKAKAIGDKANSSLSGFSPKSRIKVEIRISSSFGDEVVAEYEY